MPRSAGIAAAAAVFAIVSASATALAVPVPDATWPMYQYAPDHNAVFDAPDWNVSWKIDLSKDCSAAPNACFSTDEYVTAEINGGLSIVGRTIYVESYDKRLYAIDALTGRERWSAPMENIAMNTPLVGDGLVLASTGGASAYTATSTGGLVFGRPEGDAIDAFNTQSGARVWRYATAGSNMPTGALTLGTSPAFLFTNGDSRARALELASGVPQWDVPTPGAGVMSALAVSGGVAYGSTGYGLATPQFRKAFAEHDAVALAHAGWTWAMRIGDGKILWQSPYGLGHASPAVADGKVFVETAMTASWTDPGIRTNKVVALDATTGALLWHYDTGPGRARSRGTGNDAIGGTYDHGTLYQTLPYGSTFAAIDAGNGHPRWTIGTHAPVKMSPLVLDGTVYFGDTDGTFYLVRATDGAIEREIKFPSIFTTSPPVIVGHTLFVGNGSTLYALRLQDLQSGDLSAVDIR